MATLLEVKVPDIGDFKDVPVIEILVKPGDPVKAETSLVTLESDKATMDVPSPAAGVVKEVKVKVGDSLSEGGLVAMIEADEAADAGGAAAAQDSGRAAAAAAGERTAAPGAEPDAVVEPVAAASEPDNLAKASMAGQSSATPDTAQAQASPPPASAPPAAAVAAPAPAAPPHSTPSVGSRPTRTRQLGSSAAAQRRRWLAAAGE